MHGLAYAVVVAWPLLASITSAASIDRRANPCQTADVVSHDLCGDLARKCGISQDDLLRYNPQQDFCTTLKVPQKVCCSPGELPIPKPDAKTGDCATYTIKNKDTCWAIANSLSNLITADDLETYNKNTWGWGGCSNLQNNTNICLSPGNPPLPKPDPNAMCGPTKSGTKMPPGTDLASLNPCPLNACCDLWGYCGTTEEFCLPVPSGQAPGAPPATATPNSGPPRICVSNCGTDIVNNGAAPSTHFSIGYFEGYGVSRPCGNVDIRAIDLAKYTHIHFAFATITADTFQVDMGPTVNQFYYFKQLKGVKKILSFGGWSFSTDPETYGIFRKGVQSVNRQQLAKNIADFVNDNGLDGVDIDWEYPAAPDIPGIPSADPVEGQAYLDFMKDLKALLPSPKTLSFAAPASFWYLRGLPIDKIVNVVDYIVYMTYDLHGQWDYNNSWSDPGCPLGNCLRSHVNFTETMNALAMITKAGAPSTKIVVGVTSYGRAFQMTTRDCTGPLCTYTGPASGATPGKCTGTAGYISNSEIKDIIARNNTDTNIKTFFDSDSMTNILVYDDTQWVAYMDDNNKKTRTNRYRGLNFLGVSDWAIDLDTAGTGPDTGNSRGTDGGDPSTQAAVVPQLHKSCDAYKDIILQAWKEAGELSTAPLKWTRANAYQNVLNNYLGPKSSQYPLVGIDHIWQNFKKHHGAHYGGDSSFSFLYSYYYCDQNQMPTKVKDKFGRIPNQCHYRAKKKSGIAAKTWRFYGTVYSQYYTLLCPWWLGQEKGAPPWSSLQEIAYEGDSYGPLREQIDRWSNSVRAVTIHHETNHWQDISSPPCDALEYYEPEVIVSFARNGGSDGYERMLRNAHSWALSSTAMWMMQRWHSSAVPMPRKPIPARPPTTLDQPDSDNDDDVSDDIWMDGLDDDWFDPSRVNPADFTPLDAYGSLGTDPALSWCEDGELYETEDHCLLVCNLGGACSKTTDGTFKCSGCPPPQPPPAADPQTPTGQGTDHQTPTGGPDPQTPTGPPRGPPQTPSGQSPHSQTVEPQSSHSQTAGVQ